MRDKRITYFKQETDYTCGAATFRMVLSAFFKDVPSESELAAELKTNDRIGTHPEEMVAAAHRRGMEVIYEQEGTLERLDDLIEKGYVIALMISVDVPHVVIYLGSNGSHVFFHDPYFGERLARERRKFISDKNKYPFCRWWIDAAEIKKYLPDYDFTEVESRRAYLAFKPIQYD